LPDKDVLLFSDGTLPLGRIDVSKDKGEGVVESEEDFKGRGDDGQ